MKSIPTQLWRTGEILSPTSLRRAYDGMARDIDDVAAQRYTYSYMRVPLNDITHDDGAAEKEVIIKPPWALDVVSVRLDIAGDDNAAGNCIFTLTATGITGWEDVTVTNNSQTALASASANFRGHIAANQEVVFTVSGSTAAWTITAGYAIVCIRHDRFDGQRPSSFSPRNQASGVATAAADFNTTFNNFDTDAAALSSAANTKRAAIEIRMIRNVAAHKGIGSPGYETLYCPGVGRTIIVADFYLVRASGANENIDFDILDEAAATILVTGGPVTVAGSGSATTAKAQANTTGPPGALPTQLDDPDDSADSFVLRMDDDAAAAATILKAYTVIYYE